MSIKYDEIVPWGRSYREYIQMFNLTENDLNLRIIGVGDGPAGFNAFMHKRNKNILSIDPIYQYSAQEIKERIDATYLTVLEQTRLNQNKFVWKQISSITELAKIRMNAMNEFLDDFEKGKEESRYIVGELPTLPLLDKTYDMALISHLLFLYSEKLSTEFHLQSVLECLRVSSEVRIFPVLDLNASVSVHLEPVMSYFSNEGKTVSLEQVDYEFQKGGNQMLRIKN